MKNEKEYTYKVRVRISVVEYFTEKIEVTAMSEKEAQAKCKELISDDIDFGDFCNGDAEYDFWKFDLLKVEDQSVARCDKTLEMF